MKKTASVFLIILTLFILVSCKEKTKTFYTYFDTVISVSSYANETYKKFEKNCMEIESLLDKYNRLFDIYHEYSSLNNLCTVNNNAGTSVAVDPELIELLDYSKKCYQLTNGEVNIMLGSVLKLWNDTVPSDGDLLKASEHCSIESLVLDKQHSTVTITDKDARIDVGAIAKGYAVEKIAQYLKQKGVDGYIINAGGNVKLLGSKPDGSDFKIAIQSPDSESDYAEVLSLHDTSCVTSGSYRRFFVQDGIKYHHIIDKDTLYPADFFDSVSIITADSAYADALSTALFCMSYQEGLKLAEALGNISVLWITTDGEKYTYEN